MLQSSTTRKREIAIEARDQGPWQIPLPSPEALTRRRRIERIIEGLFVDSGYEEIAVPVVDYEAPDLGSGRRYRLLDRDGELLALRADFTPFVLRAISRLSSPRERVWYRGDVVQPGPTVLGAPVESWEMGAELLGDSEDDDLEILRLAAKAGSVADPRVRIEISDVRLVEAIVGNPSSPNLVREVQMSLQSKSPAGLESFRDLFDERTFDRLERLRSGALDASQLDGRAHEIASKLDHLRSALDMESCQVHLDDISESNLYYSALRFRIIASGGTLLGLGGRYEFPRNGDVPTRGIGFKLGLDGMTRVAGSLP